jgi:prophage maintenance system killer protein
LDGNKRAGIAVAALFLRVNGFELKTTNREPELFTLDTTVHKPELSEMAAWFEQHSRKVS